MTFNKKKMAKFLDLDGLSAFYGKIKANYPQLEEDSAGNKKIPSSYLPSYVDDVLEGYLYNSKFYEDTAHTKEITAEAGKIYTDLSTNKIYRWSGTQYTVISDTIATGTTTGTAYDGAKGASLEEAAFASVTGSGTNTLAFKNSAGNQKASFVVNNVANATTAASATKATQDGSGNTITSKYLYKIGGSIGTTAYALQSFVPSSTTAVNTVTIPVFTAATATTAGKIGIVPAPAASADYDKQFLSADGTWKTVNIADAFVKVDHEEDHYAAYRFEDMSGTTYELPAITTDKAGIIKLGSATVLTSTYATGTAGSDGITQPLQVNANYQGGVFIPYASSTAFGVVKAGTNITILNGVISSKDTTYTLPTASASVLGGVKVGSNLSINNGVLSATAYTLTKTAATTSATDKFTLTNGSAQALTVATSATSATAPGVYGVVHTTSTVTNASGYTPVPIVNGVPYYKDTNTTYSAATTSTLGLIKGDNNTVTLNNGVLSVNTITTAEIEALFA